MSTRQTTRRELLSLAGRWSRQAQRVSPHGELRGRMPPAAELVNLLEFDEAAGIALAAAVHAVISGSDREPFDYMTLWPRVLIDSAPLNLTTELFGEKMFAPIIVGPVGNQKRFHPEGELATVQGAAAAKATVVISADSSIQIEEVAAKAKTTIWHQAYSGGDSNAVRAQVDRAVKAGCRAVCLTVGTQPVNPSRAAALPRPNWRAIERIRESLNVPVLLKGVMTPDDATRAIEAGVNGIVVSNSGASGARPAPITVLPTIVAAVGGKVPVLVDGSFRRGSDVIKALAFGARAVLLARPPIWGLAAYGASGVELVVKMLQTDLARQMIIVGRPMIQNIDRALVTIHRRASS